MGMFSIFWGMGQPLWNSLVEVAMLSAFLLLVGWIFNRIMKMIGLRFGALGFIRKVLVLAVVAYLGFLHLAMSIELSNVKHHFHQVVTFREWAKISRPSGSDRVVEPVYTDQLNRLIVQRNERFRIRGAIGLISWSADAKIGFTPNLYLVRPWRPFLPQWVQASVPDPWGSEKKGVADPGPLPRP